MLLDYQHPKIPAGIKHVEVPVIQATEKSLQGYGKLVRKEEYLNYPIEIVRWPASGTRVVDEDTGDEAGTVSGDFDFYWEGDFFKGKNHAVNSEYLFGWSKAPEKASASGTEEPERVMLWHANYHPDGGQLFFPLEGKTFISPLALPGDSVTPGDFKAFRVENGLGLYIHPNVWHEAIIPLEKKARFYDEQGAVHARVSVHFPNEFGVLLSIPLKR
ncbi:ureidoglycolate lyase [Cyclobacterium sp.]|uniref:ureidoglycolate lyase n=1 Tax=Cyclobacterium sp. TaxID=1966343 RepID=UPI0019C5D772|nr:ureidoglycolate lyase [Cyclobacterium sp.]MBD3627327.1 ureidoglycolate lyase [Cyclobacterium sp.]